VTAATPAPARPRARTGVNPIHQTAQSPRSSGVIVEHQPLKRPLHLPARCCGRFRERRREHRQQIDQVRAGGDGESPVRTTPAPRPHHSRHHGRRAGPGGGDAGA
jgi:hypothetical protein